MSYDLVIREGMILDGTGKPRFLGDIGTRDGRIADIGVPSLAGADAKKTITAAGRFVAPGFIDLTSHADQNWSLFLNPGQDYLLAQGVTTILVGNCGSSLAPLLSDDAAMGLRKWSQTGDANINWASVKELLDELARHPLGVNVATLAGHGTIRRAVQRGEARPFLPEEAAQFTEALARALDDGAFGLSAGLVYSHEQAASLDELNAMGRLLVEKGGVMKLHLRHEGSDLVPSVNEAVHIARESKAPVLISHLKAVGRKTWPFFTNVLAMIARAQESGISIRFDLSPYDRTGSFLYLLLPAWAREGGFVKMLERIQDPTNRQEILRALREETIVPERYLVSGATMLKSGQTLAEIAANAGLSPEEAILELLTLNRGRVHIFGKTVSPENITEGIKHPAAIVASDGSGVSRELEQSGKLVHPRSTGAFPHFLRHFIREQELLPWEEAIRKITSAPADAVGFSNRGRIAPNYHADLVVFDPDALADQSTYQSPFARAIGVDAVVVNGSVAFENGAPASKASGAVIRRS